jgi:erythromycin esterase-like protein
MGQGGELNVGQLVRQRYGDDACLIGFTTFTGTVTAAHDWDEPGRRRDVRPGLPGSVESLLHSLELPHFLLDLTRAPARTVLEEELLERAIGVIYRPETERHSHYFEAKVARQFDLLIHLDETEALKPLERTHGWEVGEEEVPETYPSAL